VSTVSTAFDKRRAGRFARFIDEAEGGLRRHSHSHSEAQLTQLVSLGAKLDGVNIPGPTPEFRSSLRAQLMAKAERDGIGATAKEPEDSLFTKPRRSRTRVAIVIGIAGGTLAVSGISMASGDANPGDPLYQVKRSTEKAQLALAGSDLSRGQLYLEFARTRLTEAHAVHADADGFGSAMVDMDANTVDGIRLLTTTAMSHKDPAALDAVDRFVADQRYLVNQLTSLVGVGSQPRVDASLALLDQISNRSHTLRAALACGSGTAATIDALGPTAAPCIPAVTVQPEAAAPKSNAGTAGAADKPDVASNALAANTAPQLPASAREEGLLGEFGRILGDLLGN
jgi:hypothetical protein